MAHAIDQTVLCDPMWVLRWGLCAGPQRDFVSMESTLGGPNRRADTGLGNKPKSSPTVLTPKGARATKTEGTNMAVRRDVLVELEGFDPGFAFFLGRD